MDDLPPDSFEDSLESFFAREFIRLRDGLVGRSVAENEAHAVARCAFLNRVQLHPAFQEVCTRFDEETGVAAALRRAAASMDTLATTFRLPHRGYLKRFFEEHLSPDGVLSVTIDIDDEEQAEIVRDRIERIIRELGQNLKDVFAAFASPRVERLTSDLIHLVRDVWRLPYPWLALQLFEVWLYGRLAWLFGAKLSIRVWFEPEEPPAPPLRFVFQTDPARETSVEAYLRFCREAAAVLQQLENQRLPAGKRRNNEVLERYVDWFYRHRILGESIRHISRTDEADRKEVKDGIREAERILGLTCYTFPLGEIG